jgi:hypothetical protein
MNFYIILICLLFIIYFLSLTNNQFLIYLIYKIYHKMISKKKQIFTKYKTKHKTLKRKTLSGSGIFGDISSSIGSAVYHKPENKNYAVHVPGSKYIKLLNPATFSKFTNVKPPSLLTVIFNYHKPNQLNLNNISNNTVFKSGQVEYEPYINIDNMKRYLVIMYDTITKKMHYVIEFKNRSKFKTILSYLSPKPEDGIVHKYVFQLINYPENLSPLLIDDMSNPKRHKMFREVFNYIKTNNLLPAVITKVFNVKFDMSSGVSIFNIGKIIGSQKQNQKKTFKASKLSSSSKA